MKQAIFKVFAVFITVVAVAMMGASLATFVVHPDFRAEMTTPPMMNYTFEEVPGEIPKWNVTRRFSNNPANPQDRGTIGSFSTPYEALTKAHADLKNYLAQQTTTMAAQQTVAKSEAQLYRASQDTDVRALALRAEQLAAAAQQQSALLQTRSEELQALSVKSLEIREETAARRTDVLRLRHELEEARTDLFRLTAIRRDLMDRLVRLEIENQEIRDRQAQLEGKTGIAVP